ncbi:MAG: abortive infection family protein [Myxococcales bacterium]|nr:abortive infection family protein [Myxococcales bacterium]
MTLVLSPDSHDALVRLICGDEAPSPYRKGAKLVEFFNALGFEDSYGQGFPSRKAYCADRLKACDPDQLESAITRAVDPRHYLDVEGGVQPAVDFLNSRLHFDDLELAPTAKGYQLLRRHTGALLSMETEGIRLDEYSIARIDENFEKARQKLSLGDYSGAITNARTLLESVIGGIERRLGVSASGERLPTRFSRLRKLLADRVDPTAVNILKGFGGVVQGIAEARNSMSDAHEGDREPLDYEARLVVESSSVIAAFLVAVVPKPES